MGDWALVKMTTLQHPQLADVGVLDLKCDGPHQIIHQVRHNTFGLALSPAFCIHSSFLTLHLVPYYIAHPGISDVIVPLKALPQEVLDCFNQPCLDVGQPPSWL